MRIDDEQVTGAVTQTGEGVPNVEVSAAVSASKGLAMAIKAASERYDLVEL
jgi:hypothetical protein